MRHKVAGKKLGRTTSHRIAMTRNMASSLIEHERIITTVQKAKNLRPFVEKLITLAKDPSLHHRRQVFARLRNEDATAKLMEVLGPRFKERPGGYTRILKLAKPRLGDNGQRAIIELVERTVEEDSPVEESAETVEAKA
ncbi:50S ribosomal protein L17 [Planctomycetes bacterium Pla163]|uniref:Large ribosomal subunit protein bL17 n=1 Tax=Rohdeia mirabilis TaxID=2528008 RepID=A0A518D2T6_9BACT|nr:50S ribosomal protein L17 [Planctomycetes bacterium Pla163]